MPSTTAVAIYSIDPGGTTGIATCLANIGQPTVARCISRACAKGHLRTWNETGSYTEQAWSISHSIVDFFFNVHVERGIVAADCCFIVIEDFHLRLMSADLSPIWITAGIEVLLSDAMSGQWHLNGFYSKQSPSEAKGFCTDAMLKKWKLFKHKSPHERDAIRHVARRLDRLLIEG
jgi:hypothetical protein